MPTFIEYQEAADRFRTLSRRLGDAAERPRGAVGIVEGPVADHHRRHADEFRRLLADAGQALVDLASRCDHRAEVCRAYARSIRRYEALGLVERLGTPPPVPPAAWVEA